MEPEMNEMVRSMQAGLERLANAALALESQAARLEQWGEAQSGEVRKITAAIETERGASARELELERKLLQMEQSLSALQAAAANSEGSRDQKVAARKTLPSATVQLLAKQGIDLSDASQGLDASDVQSVDAALAGLSLEQRFAVKAQLIRTGALAL